MRHRGVEGTTFFQIAITDNNRKRDRTRGDMETTSGASVSVLQKRGKHSSQTEHAKLYSM